VLTAHGAVLRFGCDGWALVFTDLGDMPVLPVRGSCLGDMFAIPLDTANFAAAPYTCSRRFTRFDRLPFEHSDIRASLLLRALAGGSFTHDVWCRIAKQRAFARDGWRRVSGDRRDSTHGATLGYHHVVTPDDMIQLIAAVICATPL